MDTPRGGMDTHSGGMDRHGMRQGDGTGDGTVDPTGTRPIDSHQTDSKHLGQSPWPVGLVALALCLCPIRCLCEYIPFTEVLTTSSTI